MFAVIEDGSRQHRVQEGDLLSVDYRSDAEIGAALEFDRVLLANAGGASVIGKPVIDGASVAAEVINDEEKSNFDRAIAFYIVNKCSFSGLTESSSFSPQASDSNFSLNGIGRLHEYSDLIQNWTITI